MDPWLQVARPPLPGVHRVHEAARIFRCERREQRLSVDLRVEDLAWLSGPFEHDALAVVADRAHLAERKRRALADRALHRSLDHLLEIGAEAGTLHVRGVGLLLHLAQRFRGETAADRVAEQREVDPAVRRDDADVPLRQRFFLGWCAGGSHRRRGRGARRLRWRMLVATAIVTTRARHRREPDRGEGDGETSIQHVIPPWGWLG